MKYIHSIKRIFISGTLFIALWQIICWTTDFNPSLLPGPVRVWYALIQMFGEGNILNDIQDSMYRFAIGYLLAALSAIILGLTLGWFKEIFAYINPIVQLLRPISPIAWMPFIVLLFGIGDVPAIVIIFISAFFPILLSTISAVGNVDKMYLKVADNFDIKQPYVLTKIIFPATFPQIANGLHIALGSSWIFLVAGEMVGSQTGLGYLIIDARNNLRTDILLATIIIIGVIGLFLDTLISQFEKQIYTRWGYEREGKK
ncbi:ABC transporter permease [Lacrimispora algidixylanolytica]|uniref:Sulfonate ABC transporter permease n=1 Tax=Lacrimispora algidixylanolytica TaxID=94868 RepID=A0A419T1M6_9FIRM|nr:ABC transporter permease [Lacrimispora algidixylanolytica]RKD31356.1 sulfonate ABC transporter permease [Lacrimispora algidixylanolytica]